MRYLVVCALLAASTAFSASRTEVTVVLTFEPGHSEAVVGELKHELTGLFEESGLDLDLKLVGDLGPYPQFRRVVMVRFQGTCRMDRMPRVLERQGSLGFSHVIDGELLPFIEIRCDLVRDLVRSAIVNDNPERDLLLGRALGRVVAHELYHVLVRTCKHGHGPAQPMLSGAQLISSRMAFDSADLEKLRALP